jgi:hypothetical protein
MILLIGGYSKRKATRRKEKDYFTRYSRLPKNDPKQYENDTKLTLFYRFLPVSKTDGNGKSPMF